MSDMLEQLKKLDYRLKENQMPLRRTVAEAQGWTIKEANSQFGIVYDLIAPDGGNMTEMLLCAEVSDAWEQAPDFVNDLNAAIALLDEIGEWVDIRWVKLKEGLVYWVNATVWGNPRIFNVRIEHTDLCIACCLAYIGWKQAQVKA